jgi:hypothetical protein
LRTGAKTSDKSLVISMADRHVDGDHSKGAALNELSLRGG